MQPINSLHDFFQRSGAEVRLYHLGRRVEPCALETLASFEAGDLAWPAPWQGTARLAMVFRLGDMQDPLIWFLALPLDEQGHLDPAPRDAFVQRLLETLGPSVQGLGRAEGNRIDNLMKDNPLAFSPSLPFQAVLHARASRDAGLPASEHLEPAEAYLTGQQTIDWRALGLQGISTDARCSMRDPELPATAVVVIRRMDEATSRALADRLDALPGEVLVSLCYCLEHVDIDADLARALRRRGEAAGADGDIETFCACVRAMGGASTEQAGAWFDVLLDDPDACGPDLLAAMAGRGWHHLEDAERLPRFLTRLAETPGADFMAVVRDLALIPRLRLPLLMTLREAGADSAIGRRLAGLSR